MEVKPLCEDPIRLCFEAGEVNAAVVGIGEPITAYYAFKQGLVEADQLLLVCLRCPSFGINILNALVHPRFQESCHPSDQYIRGLEDMTNASLQRGR